MAMSLRTNVASMNAQRNVLVTEMKLDSSMARLSSGFRITKAGDDAAGLAISSALVSQIRSYGQAARNASDGLSVIQTSEAALEENNNILSRLRELAMQSASSTLSNTERSYIASEVTALTGEIDRIAQVTEFNNQKLLNGAGTTLTFQVGTRDGADNRTSRESTGNLGGGGRDPRSARRARQGPSVFHR